LCYNAKVMNFIKFLGTGGARVVVARQLRASGGIWLSLDGTNLLVDPGPGSLTGCFSSRPKLDPTTLNGILLSHKHLDHAGDINTMIEAMTIGGKERRGIVLVPGDALYGDDPIIYKYLRSYVDGIGELKEKGKYKIGNIKIQTPVRHVHGVETYGLIFKGKKTSIAYISDTKYFPGLEKKYKADILIINVLMVDYYKYNHLCVNDARTIIETAKPKATILTHFGNWMLRAGPEKIAERLSQKTGRKVIAARDGMVYKLN